jgi:hypothetical protein
MASRTHSFLVDEVTDDNKAQPRAVVLLLGWWGARIKHLTKYAELYKSRKCLTVQAIAVDMAVLTHNNRLLDECALIAASETAKILRELGNDTVPVIIHSFSNGGAYVVERLEVLIQEARDGKKHGESNEDLILVGERLQGQIFDSAPAYPTASSAIKAMSSVFSNSLLRALLSILVTLHACYDYALHNYFGYPDGRKDFFKYMANSRICLKQAYIYSAADEITDVVKLEELIAARQKISDVQICKFDDSFHVQHLRKHVAVYHEFVDSFLKGIDTPKSVKTE